MRRGKYKIIILGVVIALILAAATAVVLVKLHQTNPFPENIKNSVNFSLIYPTRNKINPSSIQTVDGVVSYTVNYKDSVMYVTLQFPPKYFDFTSFEKQITQSKSIRTPLGKAMLGSLSNHQIGTLKTDDCWVLITATIDTPQSDIEAILQQLKKS